MRIPVPQNRLKPAKENLLKIDQFQGINIAVTDTQIGNNESPDMLNLTLDDMGALNKRFGYREVVPVPGSRVDGLFSFTKMGGKKATGFSGIGLPNGTPNNGYRIIGVRDGENELIGYDEEIINSPYKVKKLCQTYYGVICLLFDGRLMSWGNNNKGQIALGYAVEEVLASPTINKTDLRFVDIDMGTEHTVALDEEGRVWTWGSNQYAQIGNGTLGGYYVTSPYQCPIPEKVVQIEASDHATFVLTESGTIYRWGRSLYGELGLLGTYPNFYSPIPFDGVHTKISASNYMFCAMRDDGKIYAIGSSDKGQLGTGSTSVTNNTFAEVVFPGTGISDFSMGYSGIIVLDTNGDVYSSGIYSHIPYSTRSTLATVQFIGLHYQIEKVCGAKTSYHPINLFKGEDNMIHVFSPLTNNGIALTFGAGYDISPTAYYSGEEPYQLTMISYDDAEANEPVEYLMGASDGILFRWVPEGAYDVVYSGLQAGDVHTFYFRDNLYIQDGNNYRLYNGTNVMDVTGYIPTVSIGSLPEGGGTPFEQLNLLSDGFKVRFTGDGTATVYQLPLDNLDLAKVPIVYVDGVQKISGTDFTVDYGLGTVTFTVAPTDNVDNVEITAYRTFDGNADKIKKCRINTIYGGAGDTRVFLSGNPEFPNMDFRSGLMDPSYFPINGYAELGTSDEKITGYAKQYSSLVVFKERSQYIRNESLPDNATETIYPVKRLNDVVGCVGFDQVQLVENFPVYIDNKGVYITQSTQIADERNVKLLSGNVNRRSNMLSTRGILDEGSLEDFKSVDFDKKYMMFNRETGVVWVYDYQFEKWFKWNNVFANCFFVYDGKLYFGDSKQGMIQRFSTFDDVMPYRDGTQAIRCYWRSKSFDFNSPMYNKLVSKLFYAIKPAPKTSTVLRIKTTRTTDWEIAESQETSVSFTYSLFTYSTMVYSGNTLFPIVTRTKLRAKKIGYLQLEFANENIDEGFGLLSIEMLYRYMYEQK